MSREEHYHDMDGNPITLEKLVRTEPEWAVSCIRESRFLMWALQEMIRREVGDVDSYIAHLRARYEEKS